MHLKQIAAATKNLSIWDPPGVTSNGPICDVSFEMWSIFYSSQTTKNLGRILISSSWRALTYYGGYRVHVLCMLQLSGSRSLRAQVAMGEKMGTNARMWQRLLDWTWVTNNQLQVQEVICSSLRSTDTGCLFRPRNLLRDANLFTQPDPCVISR